MADFDERIEKIKKQIRSLNKEKKELQKNIVKVEQEKTEVLEANFYKQYEKTSESVRADYIRRLSVLCSPCLRGHHVKYNSLDITSEDVIKPGASHIRLLPENYHVAKLSQMEVDAFAVIGKTIHIAPKVHSEYWGN